MRKIVLSLLLIVNCNLLVCKEISALNEVTSCDERPDSTQVTTPLQDKTMEKDKEINSKLSDSLKTIKGRDKKMNSEILKLKKQLAKKEKNLASLREELSKSKKKMDESEIRKLQDSMAILSSVIQTKLSEKDSISKEASATDEMITRVTEKKDMLETIMNEVYEKTSLIYNGNLERPLSTISIENLTQAIETCKKYAVDERMHTMGEKAENLLFSKKIYDKAQGILYVQYKHQDVTAVQKALSTITGLNTYQVQEVETLRELLLKFDKGVRTFKKFISELNERRGGTNNYTTRDFNDDLEIIRSKLAEEIDKFITPIPYLQMNFKNYLDAISFEPMSHPEIENEILNSSLSNESNLL